MEEECNDTDEEYVNFGKDENPPHHTLSLYLKFVALPLPRHPPYPCRLPLQRTVKRFRNYQLPAKSFQAIVKELASGLFLTLADALGIPVSSAIFSQAIQTVIDKYLDKMRTCSISNIQQLPSPYLHFTDGHSVSFPRKDNRKQQFRLIREF